MTIYISLQENISWYGFFLTILVHRIYSKQVSLDDISVYTPLYCRAVQTSDALHENKPDTNKTNIKISNQTMWFFHVEKGATVVFM